MTTGAGRSSASPSDAGDDGRLPVEDAATRGIEALQAAAHDMISAAKALLEVADDLVADPRAAGGLLSALSSMVVTPLREVPPGGGSDARGEDQHDDDDDGDGRVQRIPVS